MIQSKTHGDNWIRVGITDNLQELELLVEWCNEQNSQTSYCFVPPRLLQLNPRTFQPMPEIWFEDQAMANWFTLRWGHLW